MADNARFQELYGYATNSSGAANAQFEKTLDSLEAKLNRLKNAWNELVMGLMNSDIVKFLVDGLTSLITIINKLTQGTDGLTSAFLKWGLVITGGKYLKEGLGKLLTHVSTLMYDTGTFGGSKLADGITKGVGKKQNTIKAALVKALSVKIPGEELIDLGGVLDAKRPFGENSSIFDTAPLKEYVASYKELDDYQAGAIRTALEGNEIFREQGRTLSENSLAQILSIDLNQNQAQIQQEINDIMAEGIPLQQAQSKSLVQLIGYKVAEIGYRIKNKFALQGETVASGLLDKQQKTTAMSGAAATATGLAAIAAIIAALWLLSKAFKAIQASTLEARIKAAEEHAEQLKQNAEAAVSAFNNFKDSVKTFEDLNKELSKLIRGSDEWREKMLEVNDAVDELIKKYPSLVPYLQYGADGAWGLDKNGIELAEKQLEANARRAKAISVVGQGLKVSLDRQKALADIMMSGARAFSQEAPRYAGRDRYAKNIEQRTHWTEEETKASGRIKRSFSEEYQEYISDPGQYRDKLDRWIKAGFYDQAATEQILNSLNDLRRYNLEDELRMEQKYSKFYAAELLDPSEISSKTIDAVSSFMSPVILGGDYEKKVKEIKKTLPKTATELNRQLEALGVDQETIKSYGTIEEKRQAVAEQQATEQNRVAMEDLAHYIDGVRDENKRADITRLMSGDWVQVDLENLGEDGSILEMLAEAIGLDAEHLQQLGFTEEIVQRMVDRNAQLFDEAAKKLPSFLLKDNIWKSFSEDLSAQAQHSLAEQFQTAFIRSGEDQVGLKDYLLQIQELTKDLSVDDTNKFVKALSSIDLTQELDLDLFKGELARAGIEVTDLSEDGLEKLINQANRLNHATKFIDLDKLTKQLQDLRKMLSELYSGKHEGKFTQTEFQQIVEADPGLMSEFWEDYEGNFVYVGDGLHLLANAIEKSLGVGIKEGQQQAAEIVKMGEHFDRLVANRDVGYGGYKVSDEFILESLQKSGDVELLGIENFTKDTILDPTLAAEIMEELARKLPELVFEAESDAEIARSREARDKATSLGAAGLAAEYSEDMDPEALDLYERGLRFLAVQLGVTAEEVDKYKASLSGMGYTQKELDFHARALAISNAELEKQMSETLDTAKEYTKGLEEMEKGSEDYIITTQALAKALGLNMSNPLLENAELLDLLAEAADGSVDALVGLRDALLEPFMVYIDGEGHLDLDQVYAASAELGAQAEEVFALLAKLGMMEINTVTTQANVRYPTPVYDEANNLMGVEWKTFEAGQQIQVLSPVNTFSLRERQLSRTGYAPKTAKKGGGGGSKKEEPWKNSYDWLYNLTQKINAELRTREKLERNYDRILKARGTSGKDLLDNSKKELRSLEKEYGLQSAMLRNRQAEMDRYLKDNKKLAEYATYDAANQVVQIDYDAINKVTDPALGKGVEEYTGKLEEIASAIVDAEEAIWNIDDKVDEIRKRGEDTYFSLEKRALEAVIGSYQRQIDKLSNINDSINETNDRLISEIRYSLDKMRQERENERTEESITDKQTRLAYLRQDTSGANLTEILRLEKELEQETESYTDQLIDQKISALENQNEEARKQREKQIELAQSHLDWMVAQGLLWDEVYQLINEAYDGEGNFLTDSNLAKVISEHEGWDAESEKGKKKNLENLASDAAAAWEYLQEVDFTPQVINNIDIKVPVQPPPNVVVTVNVSGSTSSTDTNLGLSDFPPDLSNVPPRGDPLTEWVPITRKGETTMIRRNQLAWYRKEGWIEIPRVVGTPGRGGMTEFTTGGLADFTGPAWLDGTPSKPELVLNATETKNFLQLKDILSSLLGRAVCGSAEVAGNTYFDISINVDELASDYDVEQVAEKLKNIIYSDAKYRNVHSIGNLR